MIKKTVLKLSLLVFTVLAATSLLTSSALADSINLSLATPIQSGTAGSTLSFIATATDPGAKGATIYLNGDSFNQPSALSINDDGFFTGFPLSLDGGDSYTGLLFTVTLASNIAPGQYLGVFSILGGADGAAQDLLGTVNYTVNVAPVTSAVPEPESLMLLATGLPGLAVLVRSKRHLFTRKA